MRQNEKSTGVDEALLSFRPIEAELLKPGELYLFIRSNESDAPKDVLWGVFARKENRGELLLESASFDLRHFACWQPKPARFDCFRTATRSELRDFFYNLALRELREALKAK